MSTTTANQNTSTSTRHWNVRSCMAVACALAMALTACTGTQDDATTPGSSASTAQPALTIAPAAVPVETAPTAVEPDGIATATAGADAHYVAAAARLGATTCGPRLDRDRVERPDEVVIHWYSKCGPAVCTGQTVRPVAAAPVTDSGWCARDGVKYVFDGIYERRPAMPN